MRRTGVEFIGLLFYCAVIYLLIRPGSSGPAAISAFTSAMSALILTATSAT